MKKTSRDLWGSVENDKRRQTLASFRGFDSEATRTFFKRLLDVKRERELVFIPKASVKMH